MFEDDPKAVAKEVGKVYPNYSGDPVMIGKRMTIEEAKEMCRRDNHMNSVKKLTGNNTVLDRVSRNVKNYQLRKKQVKKRGRL